MPSEDSVASELPPLPVTVALAPRLHELCTDGLPPRIEAELSVLLHDLAVPRTPVVTVAAGPDPVMRLEVDGRGCRFPQLVIDAAVSYVLEDPAVVHVVDSGALVDRLERDGDRAVERLEALIAFVCRSAISAQPDILLPESPVRVLLELGMGIARADASSTTLSAQERERVIAESASDAIDVLVEPGYLRELMAGERPREMFPFMRDGLFVELGLPLPPFRFVAVATLPRGAFAFRINATTTMPRVGLRADTILVNDTSLRLSSHTDAVPTTNPATGQPGAIVAAEHQERLEGMGLTTWDPLGYFILAFAAAIRARAHALVTRPVVDGMLEQIGRAFPLTAAAVEHIGRDLLTEVLRGLLRDAVSVRNLRRIIELLARAEALYEEEFEIDPVTLVRWGVSDAIGHQLSRGTNTAVVYLLDPDLERAVELEADAAWPYTAVGERICAALHAETEHLPETAQRPTVLTSDAMRRPVRDALRVQFPYIAVAGFGDLPIDCNIQPIARVS
jgi:type III secretory pathway component EscV